MSTARRVSDFGDVAFAALLLVVLAAVNVWLSPSRFGPDAIMTTLGLAAPLILAAMASTPPILSGHGGFDLSVGPLMGLLNVVIVRFVLGHSLPGEVALVVIVPLILGAASGLVNGLLVTVVRLQPIVSTLSTYLIYTGLTLWLSPAPGGSIPAWLSQFAGPAALIPLVAVCGAWWLLTRSPYYEQLMATGGNDRAAYASGVPVALVRIGAYVIAGLIAGVAALALTALMGSQDPRVGPTYTLIAIASVALGGVSLAGGRGGMVMAIVGAVDLFLLQTLLTHFNVSAFTLQIAYGAVLVGAVVVNAGVGRRLAAL